MGKHVQTDVPDIFTGELKKKKKSRNVLISPSAKEKGLPIFHHSVGRKATTKIKHFRNAVLMYTRHILEVKLGSSRKIDGRVNVQKFNSKKNSKMRTRLHFD